MGPVLARDNNLKGIWYWARNIPLGTETYWSSEQEGGRERKREEEYNIPYKNKTRACAYPGRKKNMKG